jgi:hypothetical protein
MDRPYIKGAPICCAHLAGGHLEEGVGVHQPAQRLALGVRAAAWWGFRVLGFEGALVVVFGPPKSEPNKMWF